MDEIWTARRFFLAGLGAITRDFLGFVWIFSDGAVAEPWLTLEGLG
jgi:hypothetical protein